MKKTVCGGEQNKARLSTRPLTPPALAAAVALTALVLLAGCDDSGINKGQSDKVDGFYSRFTRDVGSVVDARDGKTYRTVKIGGLWWMAENLNYEIEDSSWCYDDSSFNCDKYGRLYNWNAAVKACPSGWHLPDNASEWSALVDFAGGFNYAGSKLKATDGWNDRNGTDNYGFSAIAGGYRNDEGKFYGITHNGYWWSATGNGLADEAYSRRLNHDNDQFIYVNLGKSYGLSVRCVQA